MTEQVKANPLPRRVIMRLDKASPLEAIRFGVLIFGLFIALAGCYTLFTWTILSAGGTGGSATQTMLGNALSSPVIGFIALAGLVAALGLGLSARPFALPLSGRAPPTPLPYPEISAAEAALAPDQTPAANPEIEALLAELADPATEPPRRLVVGDRLAQLGDPRPGVSLRADGLPDIAWITIPAARFIFGEGNACEERNVEMFEIGRYPVTNGQYQSFIEAGGYSDPRWWGGRSSPHPRPGRWQEANRPRENVDWFEASAYCRWLSEVLQRPIRLPTETEWECAARANGHQYPWGDRYVSGDANVDETEHTDGIWNLEQTVAVGAYPRNTSETGVMDLAGQVWEWCADPSHTSRYGTAREEDMARVLRGGSWIGRPSAARSALRSWNRPGYRNGSIGFRAVCSAPSSNPAL